MPLDPQVQALRERRAASAAAPLYELSLEQAREGDLADIRAAAGDPEPVAEVIELTIPGPAGPLPARAYRAAGGGAQPVLLYLFGGGWTLGTIDTSDAICRALTNAVGCTTVAVGYRLAPEHPFPAALEDCWTTARWLADHAAELGGDPHRLAIGGDSAGGNLAAAVTLLAKERSGPALSHQLLVYPNTDQFADTPSRRENTDPLLFNHRSVAWYWSHYLADPEDGRNPLASPLLAKDLAELPPATVITAEYDPLRDEGEQYAERLREAGVPVQATRYPGMVHGFFAMSGVLDGGRAAIAHAAQRLREAFEEPSRTDEPSGEARP
ncbi:alpha/beta hydrolase [Kitasatospora sp. NBC_01287]|uniref:alpha/beta hydrolase n=1 Tax=Kitasatospora sp. NBC_01287 TaxID=2903573 RepID=UPI00224F66D5|nr:alpha/beta hydrolase [Kitasatospora sp. NBC_01287]MCX4744834.1 alpha/beta hydrolase [Kitasatospora sp. NBC_01287]